MKLCQHGLCRQGKSVEDQDIVVGRICPKKVASLQPTIAEDEALDQMRAQKAGEKANSKMSSLKTCEVGQKEGKMRSAYSMR